MRTRAWAPPAWRAFCAVGILAWATLTFGAVYPWTYWPLLVAATAVGLTGWLSAADPAARASRPLTVGLAAVLVAMAVQIWPLARPALARVSPEADVVLRQHDLAYANAVDAGKSVESRHPISINPPATRLALVFAAALSVYLLGLSRGLRLRDVRRLAVGLTALAVVVGLIAIVQRATWNGRIYGVWSPLEGGSAFGPFVNRNHFAGWMLMAIPVALGLLFGYVARNGTPARSQQQLLWFTSSDANQILLVGFAIAVMTIALLLSLSRSGISALLAAFLFGGWFVARRLTRGARRTILLLYVLLAPASAIAWVGFDAVSSRFAEPTVASVSGRLPVWADALRIARRFPATGTGINTFGTAMIYYQTSDRERFFREAHNDYLQLAAEGGLLVCVPAGAAIAAFSLAVRRRFRDDRLNGMVYWIRAGAVMGIVAVAIQEIAEFSLQIPANSFMFATLCAMALSRPDAPQHSTAAPAPMA